MKLLFVCWLFLSFFLKNSFAQTTGTTTTSQITFSKEYFKSYLLDTKDVFISPAKWKSKDWMIAGIACSAISLAMIQDVQIRDYSKLSRNTVSSKVSENFLEPWGSGYYSIGSLGVLFLHGAFTKNQRSKKTAMLGLKAGLIAALFVRVPKFIFGRVRPYQVKEKTQWRWKGFSLKHSSFISGHTTFAFSVATVIASEYDEYPLIKIASYSIAGLSSISRIHDNKHWFSDVVGGAFFGWAIGKLIYKKNNWGIKIAPYTSPEGSGVSLVLPIK